MESVPRLRINRRLRQPLHGIEQKGKAYVSDRQTDGRTDTFNKAGLAPIAPDCGFFLYSGWALANCFGLDELGMPHAELLWSTTVGTTELSIARLCKESLPLLGTNTRGFA
jgi:hypothetical protein